MNRTKNNSYTNVFKIKVVEKALECGSNQKAAEVYGVDESNIRRWKRSIMLMSPRYRRAPLINDAVEPEVQEGPTDQ